MFDPTLARGLDYYTGLIIEVEVEGFDAGSIGGGGRYDNLIGMFTRSTSSLQFGGQAGQASIPAVGFAFGFDRLIEAMEEKGLFPDNLTTTKVLVTVPSKKLEDVSINISSLLRSNDINTEVYLNNEIGLEKQFKYAEKKEIPFVVVPIDSESVELRSKNSNGEISKEKMRIDQLLEKFKYS